MVSFQEDLRGSRTTVATYSHIWYCSRQKEHPSSLKARDDTEFLGNLTFFKPWVNLDGVYFLCRCVQCSFLHGVIVMLSSQVALMEWIKISGLAASQYQRFVFKQLQVLFLQQSFHWSIRQQWCVKNWNYWRLQSTSSEKNTDPLIADSGRGQNNQNTNVSCTSLLAHCFLFLETCTRMGSCCILYSQCRFGGGRGTPSPKSDFLNSH